ncbi:MAG: MFS transporter [Planctomycetaceae bacterium]
MSRANDSLAGADARGVSFPVTSRPVIDALDVTRAVVISQFLFAAGHLLTTGGFLYYFANALKPTATMFSVLLIVPELCEVVSLWCRPIIIRLGSRKRTWLCFFLLARFAALAIPLMAFPQFRFSNTVSFWIIVVALAVSSLCQSISYVAYLSWLSDIVPRKSFGSFFALRRLATLVIMVSIPYLTSLLRGDWSHWQSSDDIRWAYVTVFLTGGGLLLLTAIPLMRLPDIPVSWNEQEGRRTRWSRELLHTIWKNRPLRFVLISSWWLAAAQGLTQTVFYLFQTRYLHLPIGVYFLMAALMYSMQIPFNWIGGYLSDRIGDRGPLLISLPLVSLAMIFWLLATPEHPEWLYGAYAVWGLFGLINICERNLLLRVAPRSDNTIPLALSRGGGGVLAALAGLAGGALLDSLLTHNADAPHVAYRSLFVVSFILRVTAPLWLLKVTPRPQSPSYHSAQKSMPA